MAAINNSLHLRGLLAIWKYPFFSISCNKHVFLKLRRDVARRFYQSEELLGRFDVFCRILQEKNIATIFLARISDRKCIYHIMSVVFKSNKNIEILTPPDKIGAGLVVYHNLGAVIRANSIGEDVSISQGVTIGAGGGRKSKVPDCIPTIGNRVLIATNSIVIGDVTIGDDSVIGAGSLITKNVPSGAIVVGNPQRILKMSEE